MALIIFNLDTFITIAMVKIICEKFRSVIVNIVLSVFWFYSSAVDDDGDAESRGKLTTIFNVTFCAAWKGCRNLFEIGAMFFNFSWPWLTLLPVE